MLATLTRHTPLFAHYSGHTHTDTQEERGRLPKEDWREGKTKARAFLPMAFLGLHFSRSTEDTKYSRETQSKEINRDIPLFSEKSNVPVGGKE